MNDIRPLTLTNRRNNPGTDGAPSIYQACLNALARLGDHSLARHEINRTFTRSIQVDEKQNKTFIDYLKIDNQKILTAHIVGEVGSELEGTWLGAYPQKPPRSQPLNDDSNAHRMVIAARCPTGAPADLQAAWKGFIAALEDVYFEDLDAADAANESYRLTSWAGRSDGDKKKAFNNLYLKLEPTYEKASNKKVREPEGPRERNRNRPSTSTSSATVQSNIPMQATTPTRQVGDTYDPDMFSEHRGNYFDHSLDIKIIQRDHRDVDNSLIPPWELKKILTEGTFFSAQVTLQTYILKFKSKTNEPTLFFGMIYSFTAFNALVTELSRIQSLSRPHFLEFYRSPVASFAPFRRIFSIAHTSTFILNFLTYTRSTRTRYMTFVTPSTLSCSTPDSHLPPPVTSPSPTPVPIESSAPPEPSIAALVDAAHQLIELVSSQQQPSPAALHLDSQPPPSPRPASCSYCSER
ncbi:hypothetical protein B0H14DRAFT_3518584 [Mycena olivaceomarginata]|nr:hypothetical protein B0H14DRAFT_3518584 [Mycena olivaceomarginata]